MAAIHTGILLFFLSSVFSFSVHTSSRHKRASDTTPENLESIFLGRCHAYQESQFPELFLDGNIDCDELYRKFLSAFQYKEACDVTHQDYADFADAANHPLPAENVVLWEGVGGFVHDYTHKGRRMFAVSNTLAATIIDGLTWCGTTEYPGISSESCPWCDQSPVITFWRRASIEFAKQLSGYVYMMFNGSRTVGAVRDESIFSVYELPNVDPARVHTLHALIVHDVDKPVVERCGEGSLQKLQNTIESMGITYHCTDDRPDLLFLVCVDHYEHPVCQRLAGNL